MCQLHSIYVVPRDERMWFRYKQILSNITSCDTVQLVILQT